VVFALARFSYSSTPRRALERRGEVAVHLDEAQPPHTTFRVRLRIKWPGFYEGLLEGEKVAGVEWTFLRTTRNLSLEMLFAS
jgi:broad specificity phosphatase PhoE